MSDWYYAVDNEQKGPVNESELKEKLAGNKIPADSLVWKDGMDNWTPANEVAAFSFRQPPMPAKIQPPALTASKPLVTPAPVIPANPVVNNPDSTAPVDLSSVMGAPESLEVDLADSEKNKIFGILAYLPPFFLLYMIFAKDSPYAKYHGNQGLSLFVVMFAAFSISVLFSFIPFVGFVFGFVHFLLYPIYLCLVIFGIVQAAAGKCVPLPVIGGIKLLK